VTQTGVQLLTGFLLTLPFQQRFQSLDSPQRRAYLVVVVLSAGSTALLVAPVLMHRLLFRRHKRRQMVTFAHRCAMAGAYLLGLALVGVIYLIFDVTEGTVAALIAGLVVLAAVLVLWLALPWWLRRDGSGI
jgi:O-antigen/teichoic acid export membrane protein